LVSRCRGYPLLTQPDLCSRDQPDAWRGATTTHDNW